MLHLIFKVFSVRCYAAADDKKVNPATVNNNIPAANLLSGLAGTTKIKNITRTREFPFSDAICGEKKVVDIFTRESPAGDADYALLPKGSKVDQLVVAGTAVVDYKEYTHKRDGYEETETALYKELTLTNAQVLALNTTAIDAIAAPGTTKMVQPLRGFIRHNYDTAAFGLTNVTDIEFKYTNSSGAALVKVPTTGVLDQAANKKAFSNAETDLIGVANAKVVVHAHGSADPITGEGTVTVGIWYKIVDA